MSEKNKRRDGFLDSVKEFIRSDKAKIQKLVEWLEKYDAVQAESAELEKLEETLPADIDKLLASGKMDGKTIEQLARKRAHLDLIPSRQEKLYAEIERLRESEFEAASAFVEEAVRKASGLFFERQMETAVSDLMALGVSEEIARQQAILREDLQAIEPMGVAMMCGGVPETKARKLLWAYASFEAGLNPRSPDAEKFRQEWCPNG